MSDTAGEIFIDRFPHLPRVFQDKMVGEQEDVASPVAQRRQVDGKDVQAVEEVGAEPPGGEVLFEDPIRCRDDPNVDLDHPAGTERLELLLLQDAQQLDLRRGGKLPHLVEEDRPPVRLLEPSAPLVKGAGKGPPFVPEELALDQGVRNGRAVDLDEGPPEAGAFLMDRPGDQLLAGSRLPVDQDRRVRSRPPGPRGRRHPA